MFLSDFYFYFPQAAWLLLFILPLLYGQFSLERYRKKQEQAYAAPSVLPQLLSPRSFRLVQIKNLGWLLVWTGGCFALMGPVGNIHYSSSSHATFQPPPPQEILFLVDTSASMRVLDGYQGKSRLEQAKELIEALIPQLRGQLVSLDAFTSELAPIVPSTLDYLFLRLVIKDLAINSGDIGGTRFVPVLSTLRERVFSPPSSKVFTLLLFSDGGDTVLEQLQGEAKEKEKEAILNALPNPKQAHFRLFSIGLGTLKAQPIPHVTFEGHAVFSALEPEILKQLAQKGGGSYYQAQDWGSQDLAQELMKEIDNTSLRLLENWEAERKIASVQPEEVMTNLYYQIPLGIALIFYLINLGLLDNRRLLTK